MTFDIRIVGSDIVLPCGVGETVLDAAERAGYSIPYSCRKGVCSTCEGLLADGCADVGQQRMRGPRDGVLLCRAKPASDVAIAPKRIEKRNPLARKRITATVYRIRRPAPDVVILQLRFPAGTRGKFRAGQYLRVMMPDGDSRNFSMANPPHENDGVTLHIRHVPGGRFSEDVLASLSFGNEFFLRESAAKPIVLIATGTGFAPIKSIVEDMIRRDVRWPTRLYWGARAERDLYMPQLITKWSAQAGWLEITLVLSDGAAGWQRRTGLVHRAVLDDTPDLARHQVYACGNPFMIDAARRDFRRAGKLPDNEFYADPFVASGDQASGI
jgi:CDP-4-dehydro-6-deoxyglucose reductase/3-phenylpropionate/trans-cinnamate dioxygenase ferredoxin reductase subunit